MHSDAHSLGYQANRLARLLKSAIAREIAPLGITPRQAAVLLQLSEVSSMPMGPLAEGVGVDRPTLTGITERLERDGLLATSPNPHDRRSRLVALTPQAREMVPRLVSAAQAAEAGALAALSDAEAAHLIDLLRRASAGLELAADGHAS